MGFGLTVNQVSAGGVACRKQGDTVEIALIQTGSQGRWQLPKGMANQGENLEAAALREVREETGIVADLICPVDRIEYWYYVSRNQKRTRYHKYVSFFLMRYRSGDVRDHDHEVIEARWVEIGAAIDMLHFESEKAVVRLAKKMIDEGLVWESDRSFSNNLEQGEITS